LSQIFMHIMFCILEKGKTNKFEAWGETLHEET